MAIQAQFVNSPPDTITGPFSFTVTVTNDGASADDFSFEAVLINPATGEQAARVWSTNVFIGAGESRDLQFNLVESRNLQVSDGTYDLNVLYGDYPTPTNWKSAINTTVEVALNDTGGGGSDGGGNGGNGGNGSNGGNGGSGGGGNGSDTSSKGRLALVGAAAIGAGVLVSQRNKEE